MPGVPRGFPRSLRRAGCPSLGMTMGPGTFVATASGTAFRLEDAALFGFAALFALNMGGAGFTPSFSAALGAKLIHRVPAILLFTLCVGIGAFLVGPHVAKTLGEGLVP